MDQTRGDPRAAVQRSACSHSIYGMTALGAKADIRQLSAMKKSPMRIATTKKPPEPDSQFKPYDPGSGGHQCSDDSREAKVAALSGAALIQNNSRG
jgi:hypothetical protein